MLGLFFVTVMVKVDVKVIVLAAIRVKFDVRVIVLVTGLGLMLGLMF